MIFKASLLLIRWNHFGQFSTTVHHEKEFLRLHASKFFNFSFFVFRIQDETTTSIHFPLLLQNDFVVSSLLPWLTQWAFDYAQTTQLLPLDPPSTIFFLESPHIPNWKILEEHKVISYIHHDKNGGSCNFLAKKNKLPITSCCGGNNSLNSNYSFKIEIVHNTTILGCPEFSSFAKFWSASFSHQTMNHHFSERDMTVHFPPLLSRDQSNHSQTIFQGKSIRIQCAQKY